MMSIQNISQSETPTSFTIVIPTYNEESDIGVTLETLSALEYSNFDVLVIDDSTDRTPELVGKFVDERIKCVRQTRGSGRSAARNQGILV
ncbi:MAG: glycosyltransferase family 2 protein, partial [Anaerolineales bacterium]|nr:glycosyltransferase family 2 protein [Anaerolineales bacterium]